MNKKATVHKLALNTIIKRDGSAVPFDASKITRAVEKAMYAANEFRAGAPEQIAESVSKKLLLEKENRPAFTPTVEGVQDLVEAELMLCKFLATAKVYIIYREERTKLRYKGIEVSPKVKKLAADSKKYFKNQLGEFIYYRTYSKWITDENRRETWIETVDRYMDFMKENLGDKIKDFEYKEIREAILKQKAMPSMRLLQFAGTAARVNNICAYNCSYIAPEIFRDFS
ncbi:MAG: ATP cone domain-containing protein, partial [bacterium]|nr:ATP cone domain-containing protein [bacterium]